jgi:uracil-DNA glycosylase family 4
MKLDTAIGNYFRQQSESGYPEEYLLPKSVEKMQTREDVQTNPELENIATIKPQTTEIENSTKEITLAPTAPEVKTQQAPAVDYKEKRTELTKLFYELKDCNGCTLCESRKKTVFGTGNADAKAMIIGDVPTFEDEEKGLPFIGATGALLTKMITAINLDIKEDIFLTNILKCRPQGNRTFTADEARACLPTLQRQIQIIKPKMILILGEVAAQNLLECSDSISQIRGSKRSLMGIPVVVTYHPAELNRNSSLKRAAWDDLQFFQRELSLI